jgi:hypothetical protein
VDSAREVPLLESGKPKFPIRPRRKVESCVVAQRLPIFLLQTVRLNRHSKINWPSTFHGAIRFPQPYETVHSSDASD